MCFYWSRLKLWRTGFHHKYWINIQLDYKLSRLLSLSAFAIDNLQWQVEVCNRNEDLRSNFTNSFSSGTRKFKRSFQIWNTRFIFHLHRRLETTLNLSLSKISPIQHLTTLQIQRVGLQIQFLVFSNCPALLLLHFKTQSTILWTTLESVLAWEDSSLLSSSASPLFSTLSTLSLGRLQTTSTLSFTASFNWFLDFWDSNHHHKKNA